ncbi:MAG: aspartate aminotransferase family protein [Clostridia bacterium]
MIRSPAADAVQAALDRAIARYRGQRPKSYAAWSRAAGVMPGGNTRSVVYHGPFPLVMAEGAGARERDLDGHEYLDFLNNFTSLIHGHAHPAIVEAAVARLRRGSAFSAYLPEQGELAEILVSRVPGLDRVRFCNSGTEATLLAVQTARAYTGRSDIIKMEGGYHGGHDVAEVSVHPDPQIAGPADRPLAVAESRAVDQRALQGVHVAPFNDADALEAVLRDHSQETAAILLEPVMGQAGYIPPLPGYLQHVRRLADQYGVLLIFDEVQTLRVSYGGAQELYGVTPDLTAMAKIIGGGFPVGGFGGRADIMRLYDPGTDGALFHTGTFNGNPVTMVAGRVAMELLSREALDRLDRLAARFQEGLQESLRQTGLAGSVTRSGSLLGLHFTSVPPRNFREAAASPGPLAWLLYFELLERGIHTAPGRGAFNLSTVMDEPLVEDALSRVGSALAAVASAAGGAPDLA